MDSGIKPDAPVAHPRVTLKPDMGPEGYPPLPEVFNDQIRTQIFTHRSFFARPTHVFEDSSEDPSPDNEMFEHLGDSVLSLVVTGLMRDVFPYVRVGPSTKMRALVVGNPTLAEISVVYRLPEKLRVHPAQAITLRRSVNIQADLFEAYVGGLYLDRGLEVAKSWLCPLFRPYLVAAYGEVRVQHGLPRDPPAATPSSLLPGSSLLGPLGPTASVGHLSLFNQHLSQKGKTIEWSWADSAGQGTRTTPIWVVAALVDGEPVGRGRGSTKKSAKNEAAKQGLQEMGVYVSQPEAPGMVETYSL